MIAKVSDLIDSYQDKATAVAPPLDSRPATSPVVDASQILVLDGIFDDPRSYERYVRTLPFQSVTVGPAVFHGIAECADPSLPNWIRALYPKAEPTLTFFRQSPAGQLEPNYIHTDRDMGDWTAILYLTADPPATDGTTFWRRLSDGAMASTATTPEAFYEEWASWRDRSLWEPWHTVAAAPNRLLLFPAPLFHSRALPDNYGTVGSDARLIQLVFGRGSLARET